MAFAPYQWRAEHGYLPPPDSMPVPLYFPPPPPWFFPPPAAPGGQYAAYPGPPPPPYPGCGPVVAVPPPAAKPKAPKSELPAPPKVDKSIAELKSVAPGESCASTVAHFSEAAKSKASGSKKSGKEKAAANPAAPPSLPPGVDYLFPPRGEHTILHVFNKSSKKVWEGGYKGQKLAFKMFKVATSFPVKGVVENVLKIEKGKGEGWAVTEVVERGGGEWVKGTTIGYDSDKAKGSLAEMGWGPKRGGELPPVWLVVHRV